MEERYEKDVDFWSIYKDPEVRNKWMEMERSFNLNNFGDSVVEGSLRSLRLNEST